MIQYRQSRPLGTDHYPLLSALLDQTDNNLEYEADGMLLRASGFSSVQLTGRRLTLGWGCEPNGALHGRALRVEIALDQPAVVVTTDRFATLPICYAEDAGQAIAIASRADRVLTEAARAIYPQAIFDYLYFHVIPAPGTVFSGVRRVPPATRLSLALGRGAELAPWWHARFAPMPAAEAEPEGLKQQFLEIVQRSVEREAQGRYAAFLSGGTDSSTVVGMLCRLHGSARCYSMGFEAEGYDEMAYARCAAKHFGANHREYYVTPADLATQIPAVAAHYDQPFGNSSALPSYVLSRLARSEGFERLLAGDGGDELFGGNTRYAKQKLFGHYDRLPGAFRHHLLEPLLDSPLGRLPLARKAASYSRQARIPLPDRNEGHNLILRLDPTQIMESGFLAQIDPKAPLLLQQTVWRSAEADDDLNRALAFDWRFTLADNDLPKILGTAGLAGIEIGFPLLADELLDFSLNLPIAYKLKGYQLRWFFKEALRGFLPDEILTKKKHGFGLPFGVWVLKDAALGALARDALNGFAARGVLRTEFLERLERDLLPSHPGYYGEMVWIVMMLELWLRHAAPEWALR